MSTNYLLQNLSSNWHHGVNWVGDDGNESLWGLGRNTFDKVSDNGCIGVKKVITGHARFAWYTRGNNNYIGI